MNKAEKEQYITEWIKKAKADNDEFDRDRKDWRDRQIASGTDPNSFDDFFLYNGFIWASDLENIVAFALFDKPATIHHERNRYHGTYEEKNLTAEEKEKLTKVINALVAKKMVRPSKTGTMYKVLI